MKAGGHKRNQWFAFVCLQACCSILLLAAVFKGQWSLIGTSSNTFFPSWMLIGMDLSIVLLTVVFSRFSLDWACRWIVFVFAGFTFFHWINLGKPCGCFGASDSSLFTIFTNSMVGIGLGIVILAKHQKYSSLGMVLCLVANCTIFVSASLRSQPEFVNLCELISKPHPFSRSGPMSPDFSSGEWNVCILANNCESCRELAARLLGESDFLLDLLPADSIFAVYAQKNSKHWEIATIRQFRLAQVAPVCLSIQNGRIESCKKGQELFQVW